MQKTSIKNIVCFKWISNIIYSNYLTDTNFVLSFCFLYPEKMKAIFHLFFVEMSKVEYNQVMKY